MAEPGHVKWANGVLEAPLTGGLGTVKGTASSALSSASSSASCGGISLGRLATCFLAGPLPRAVSMSSLYQQHATGFL